MTSNRPILIATRGSALALAQSNLVLAGGRAAFPTLAFELKIIKTTGDKLQSASLAQQNKALPKGLFTKELEIALINREVDLAVHSLKDLPTELPPGLRLGAVSQRENVRDVLIYRDAKFLNAKPGLRGYEPHLKLKDLPIGAVIATSSPRRKAQLLAHHPGLRIVEIRGNVATRMQKLMDQAGLDATVLAFAGLARLNFKITPAGNMRGDAVPDGLLAVVLDVDVMLPCVGQGAIGIETRADDERIAKICERLNHYETMQAVTAERAFLAAMGGGCQSPVGAYAQVAGQRLQMRVVSFMNDTVRRAQARGPITEATELGRQIAAKLKE